MPRIMIVTASVRPGRIGGAIAAWVREGFAGAGIEGADFEIDDADLAQLALPFMDEPNHPRMRDYQHEHTKAWSARVEAADAFVFVTPEYNHSFAPALKNAIDYLYYEWVGKPAAFVSYGGMSAGTRGVVAIETVLAVMQMQRTAANPELAFAAQQLRDGVFEPNDAQQRARDALVAEVVERAAGVAAAR